MADEEISIAEAARIAGVTPSTLKRWANAKVLPVKRGRWTRAIAAQARVVSRMRDRGHSLNDLRQAARDGRLAFGYVEDLIPRSDRVYSRKQAASITGLEEELIERIMGLLGTPNAIEGTLTEQDLEAMKMIGGVLDRGFPLVAVLQLVRVYAQSIRKIAEAEVRLFHLFVHEPMIEEGVDALTDGRRDGDARSGSLSVDSRRSWITCTTGTCASTPSRTWSVTWRLSSWA